MSDIAQIHNALNEIAALASKIEEVPNLPQDVRTMKGIEDKARRIQQLCRWISSEIGTGYGGRGGTGAG